MWQACQNPRGRSARPRPNAALRDGTGAFGIALGLTAPLRSTDRRVASCEGARQIWKEECNLETCQSYNR